VRGALPKLWMIQTKKITKTLEGFDCCLKTGEYFAEGKSVVS
jgi:hypothetical protein